MRFKEIETTEVDKLLLIKKQAKPLSPCKFKPLYLIASFFSQNLKLVFKKIDNVKKIVQPIKF